MLEYLIVSLKLPVYFYVPLSKGFSPHSHIFPLKTNYNTMIIIVIAALVLVLVFVGSAVVVVVVVVLVSSFTLTTYTTTSSSNSSTYVSYKESTI